jgi:hypothetical protein
MRAVPVPSFTSLRRREFVVAGSVVSIEGATATIADAFSTVDVSVGKHSAGIRACFEKGVPLAMQIRKREKHLEAVDVEEITLYEEMYRTVETMEFWKAVVARTSKDNSEKQIDK